MNDKLYHCHCNGQDCFCANIKRAESRITALYNRCLEKTGITRGQYAILSNIEQNPSINVSSLAEKMDLERTTLVRNLKPLEARGFIEDTASTGRSRNLCLSAHGKAVLTKARVFWNEAQQTMEQKLGGERVELFNSLVSFIIDNI